MELVIDWERMNENLSTSDTKIFYIVQETDFLDCAEVYLSEKEICETIELLKKSHNVEIEGYEKITKTRTTFTTIIKQLIKGE